MVGPVSPSCEQRSSFRNALSGKPLETWVSIFLNLIILVRDTNALWLDQLVNATFTTNISSVFKVLQTAVAIIDRLTLHNVDTWLSSRLSDHLMSNMKLILFDQVCNSCN